MDCSQPCPSHARVAVVINLAARFALESHACVALVKMLERHACVISFVLERQNVMPVY